MHRWLTWNVLFPLHELVKGHRTFSILHEMEAADCLSWSELQSLRQQKLTGFLQYCHAHVPYVRAAMDARGLRPADIRSVEDLSLLPVMTKADVHENRSGMSRQSDSEPRRS